MKRRKGGGPLGIFQNPPTLLHADGGHGCQVLSAAFFFLSFFLLRLWSGSLALVSSGLLELGLSRWVLRDLDRLGNGWNRLWLWDGNNVSVIRQGIGFERL